MQNNLNLNKLKDYLVPVLSFLVVIALIPLVIIPQLNQIAEASKVITANKTRLDRVEAKAQKLQKLSTDKKTLENDLQVAEDALPVDKAIAPLVKGIQEVAINNGMKVLQIKMQPGKTATSSAAAKTSTPTDSTADNSVPNQATASNDTLIFTMSLTGNSAQLKDFLAFLESAKRLLLIKQFSVTGTDAKVSTTASVAVTISTPFGPLPKIGSDQIANDLPELTTENKKILEDLRSNSTEFKNQVDTVDTGVPNPFK